MRSRVCVFSIQEISFLRSINRPVHDPPFLTRIWTIQQKMFLASLGFLLERAVLVAFTKTMLTSKLRHD